MKTSPPALGMVLKGFPRISETFISNEILQLEQLGFRIHIFSMRRPRDEPQHPIHDEIRAPVVYLPEYLHEEPFRVLGSIIKLMPRRSFWPALVTWIGDLFREPTH